MAVLRCLFCLALICLWPVLILAQLTVNSPVPRMVFQRGNTNQTNVLVAGLAPAGATIVEARFVPLAVGQGEVTAWTSLSFLTDTKAFRDHVTVTAGWYRLDVRAKSGTSVLGQVSVNRVGVGEVFIIAGQSNMYGGFQRVASAAEDRVSCVDFRQDSLSEQLLPFQFSHVSYGSSIGPSQPPHIWGMLGDALVQRLNVPVLFLGAALGGTSSDQWQQSATGNIGPTQNSAVYRRLGVVLQHYVARTGARAVLWHQGESDPYTSQQTYFNNIRQVIEKSRQQTGHVLPWVVSRASYIGGQTNPGVIAAQNQLITQLPAVFPGPATDTIIGPANRADDTHMSGMGAIRFVNVWNQQLNSAFFQASQPFLPTSEASLITSGYTLPLSRKPGETIVAASVRSNPQEADNQYLVQLVRTNDGTTVAESGRSTDNPILFTLPASLPDGQYQLRTVATHPVLTGTLGEPFSVNYFASATAPQRVLRPAEISGTGDPSIQRIGYRYEDQSHSFYAMVQATSPVEFRLERLDGAFTDSDWHMVPPASQAPDWEQFADFNYLRNYPPVSGGVGGVEPGRYRLSVRRQGDGGAGISFVQYVLNGRNILYFPMEPVSDVPPVLTITSQQPTQPCASGSISVSFNVESGGMNAGNVYALRLSDAMGSFSSEATLATGSASPLVAQLPDNLPNGTQYRFRVVATNPAIASAPGPLFAICTGADLSLSMQSDTRTPAVGQPILVTLTLTNSGPAAAPGVQMQSLLPPTMTFVDAQSAGISFGSGAVSIGPVEVVANASHSFVFRVKADQPGRYTMAAQITASSLPDPDSQPNSGTEDGQDDATQLDLRTPDSGVAVFVSPNPNQTPLPPVSSSQPPTDPATADLSLAIVSDRLVLEAGHPVTLSLIVSNRGGASASDVSVATLLPASWQLITNAGFTVNGQTVLGTLSRIEAGSYATLVMMAHVANSGTVKAQIASTSGTDPDSTPGNGYDTGEDDEARLAIRVQ